MKERFLFKLHSQTVPVKTWLHKRAMLIPWSDNCCLCNQPETIDLCFVLCRDAVFFWDFLPWALKKDIDITPYTIRFLPFEYVNQVPYDVFVLLGLLSFGICRMIDWHANPLGQPGAFFGNRQRWWNLCGAKWSTRVAASLGCACLLAQVLKWCQS